MDMQYAHPDCHPQEGMARWQTELTHGGCTRVPWHGRQAQAPGRRKWR
jgi:hypothetical protein